MQENIFVRTVGLDSDNLLPIAEDLRKWLVGSSVYVQTDPARLVVVYAGGSVCTVINEGDIISFMKRATGSNHYIINHTEKKQCVHVKIGDNSFVIETFVYETVGNTDNMKFRLTCLNEPDLSGTFDDYESVKERLNEFLFEAVDERCIV